jgi:hypothetical protein
MAGEAFCLSPSGLCSQISQDIICFIEQLVEKTGFKSLASLSSLNKTCGEKIILKECEEKFIKFIPYVGAILSLIFGALEIYYGHYVLGACTIASGICSIFSGWFQVASFIFSFGGIVYQIAKAISK